MFQYNLFLGAYIAACLFLLESQAELAGVTIRYLEHGQERGENKANRITAVLKDGVIIDIYLG